MPVKDTFTYGDRFGSVGLDCSNCQHYCGPTQWPDTERVSRCDLHNVSLGIELQANGYKHWEWFCQDFVNTGGAYPPSVEHLEKIRSQLQPEVLYRFYGADGYLIEHRMSDLKAQKGAS